MQKDEYTLLKINKMNERLSRQFNRQNPIKHLMLDTFVYAKVTYKDSEYFGKEVLVNPVPLTQLAEEEYMFEALLNTEDNFNHLVYDFGNFDSMDIHSPNLIYHYGEGFTFKGISFTTSELKFQLV